MAEFAVDEEFPNPTRRLGNADLFHTEQSPRISHTPRTHNSQGRSGEASLNATSPPVESATCVESVSRPVVVRRIAPAPDSHVFPPSHDCLVSDLPTQSAVFGALQGAGVDTHAPSSPSGPSPHLTGSVDTLFSASNSPQVPPASPGSPLGWNFNLLTDQFLNPQSPARRQGNVDGADGPHISFLGSLLPCRQDGQS